MSSTSRSFTVVIIIVIIGVSIGAGSYFLVFYFIPSLNVTSPTSSTTNTHGPTDTSSFFTYDTWSTWFSTYDTTSPPTELPYDVGVVLTTEGLGDKGFNDAVYQGLINASYYLGMDFEMTQPVSISDYETHLRSFASEQPSLIIGIGFDQAAAMMSVADDYPYQKFAIVDMYIDYDSYHNIASLLFDEHEGAALVGAIASSMSATNYIGFIGGMDIPLINKYLAGYVFGANYSNPGINVSYVYTNDWIDTTAGQTIADAMYTAGLDVIFAAASRAGLGVFDSCRNHIVSEMNSTPIWNIGVDFPQMYLGTDDPDNPEAPTFTLTSMLKRVDIAVFNIIQDVHMGDFHGGTKLYNVANGGLDFETNEDLLKLPFDVLFAATMLKAEIIGGTVVVPSEIYWT